MRFVKHPINISVTNLDQSPSPMKLKRHSELLPNSIRCIVSGPSNSGKTNLLISLIEAEHGLIFENIYIYSKTLEQDKYTYLKNLLKPIKHIGFYTYSASDQVIAPSLTKKNSIMIFDDVIVDRKQDNVKKIFVSVDIGTLIVFFLRKHTVGFLSTLSKITVTYLYCSEWTV